MSYIHTYEMLTEGTVVYFIPGIFPFFLKTMYIAENIFKSLSLLKFNAFKQRIFHFFVKNVRAREIRRSLYKHRYSK